MISFTHPIRRLGGLLAIVSAAVAVAAPTVQAGVDRGVGVAPSTRSGSTTVQDALDRNPRPAVVPDAIERRVAVAERERRSHLSDATSRVSVADRPGSPDNSPRGTGSDFSVDRQLLIGVALGMLLALGLILTARVSRGGLKTS